MECIFFINPKAGAREGKRLAEQVEQLIVPSPVFKQVVFTDPDRLAQQVYSCAKGKDLVVICGGDGTISSIITHLVGIDKIPTFALIPMGTGNDIARATGWLQSWADFGLEGIFYAIKEGRTANFDVWQMDVESDEKTDSFTFCAYAGIGYDGRVCREFLKLNRFFIKKGVSKAIRRLLYVPAGMRILYKNMLHPERIRCHIAYDKDGKWQQYRARYGQLLFCNSGYYAGGSLLDRDYSFDDGLLEFFGFKGYMEYMQMLFEARLIVARCSVLPVRAKEYSLNIETSAYYQMDGEPRGVIERGSCVKIGLMRSIPLLKPLPDKYSRKKQKDAAPKAQMKKISSSVKPAVT